MLYIWSTTRSIHLDLATDASAPSFIKSLKRFTSRRRIPYLMISDNDTCFKIEEVKLSEERTRYKSNGNLLLKHHHGGVVFGKGYFSPPNKY